MQGPPQEDEALRRFQGSRRGGDARVRGGVAAAPLPARGVGQHATEGGGLTGHIKLAIGAVAAASTADAGARARALVTLGRPLIVRLRALACVGGVRREARGLDVV